MPTVGWVILLVFGVPGLVALLNLGRINERLAEPFRNYPRSLRTMNLPVTMRVVGGIFVFLGVVLAIGH